MRKGFKLYREIQTGEINLKQAEEEKEKSVLKYYDSKYEIPAAFYAGSITAGTCDTFYLVTGEVSALNMAVNFVGITAVMVLYREFKVLSNRFDMTMIDKAIAKVNGEEPKGMKR